MACGRQITQHRAALQALKDNYEPSMDADTDFKASRVVGFRVLGSPSGAPPPGGEAPSDVDLVMSVCPLIDPKP